MHAPVGKDELPMFFSSRSLVLLSSGCLGFRRTSGVGDPMIVPLDENRIPSLVRCSTTTRILLWAFADCRCVDRG